MHAGLNAGPWPPLLLARQNLHGPLPRPSRDLVKAGFHAFAKRLGFVMRPLALAPGLFPGSSVVEQPAVNRLVAGSNPARGAKQIKVLAAKNRVAGEASGQRLWRHLATNARSKKSS